MNSIYVNIMPDLQEALSMTEHFFDNLIIGGGPAGTSCGIFLKKAGAECCVIDRAVFPRDKTCGGLITAKTHNLISHIFENEDTESLFANNISAVSIYDRNICLVRTETDTGARLVHRRVFDNALMQKYKTLGGFVFENEKDYSIDYDNRKVTLSDGNTISYKYLVFADGFFSQAHELPGAGKPASSAFGVEAMLPAGSIDEDSIGLHFGYVKEGYVWVFPCGDSFCVGAAGDIKKNPDIKGILLAFLDELGINSEGIGLQAAFLPYGSVIAQDKLPDNSLLAGDAGGFADPISGEGIYFALKTGLLAAQALCGNTPKKTYLESIKPITRIIKQGVSLRDYFYKPRTQKLFLGHVKGNEAFLRYFYDHQVAEYGYAYSYDQMLKLYSDYKKSRA